MRATTRHSPSIMSAKYSGGPRWTASLLSGSAATESAITARMAPQNDEIAETLRAIPARPLRAIGYPSKAVTTDSDSPGTFMRMLVMRPPYAAP